MGGPNLTAESDFMGIVEIAGLRPATRYYYRMLIDDRATPPAATFSLVTPPPPDAAGRLRFAVTSCVGLPEEAAPAWADLAKVPIDLLLQLGDNVYAGSTDPEVQRRTYYAHRRIPAHRGSLHEPRPRRSGMTGTTPATTATAPSQVRNFR